MNKKSYEYKYFIEEHGEKLEDATSFKSAWPKCEPDFIAEDAAENLFYERDGYESTWPLKLKILTMEDEDLGTFEVEYEVVPQFHTYKVIQK